VKHEKSSTKGALHLITHLAAAAWWLSAQATASEPAALFLSRHTTARLASAPGGTGAGRLAGTCPSAGALNTVTVTGNRPGRRRLTPDGDGDRSSASGGPARRRRRGGSGCWGPLLNYTALRVPPARGATSRRRWAAECPSRPRPAGAQARRTPRPGPGPLGSFIGDSRRQPGRRRSQGDMLDSPSRR
jgi:hypothetical protein